MSPDSTFRPPTRIGTPCRFFLLSNIFDPQSATPRFPFPSTRQADQPIYDFPPRFFFDVGGCPPFSPSFSFFPGEIRWDDMSSGSRCRFFDSLYGDMRPLFFFSLHSAISFPSFVRVRFLRDIPLTENGVLFSVTFSSMALWIPSLSLFWQAVYLFYRRGFSQSRCAQIYSIYGLAAGYFVTSLTTFSLVFSNFSLFSPSGWSRFFVRNTPQVWSFYRLDFFFGFRHFWEY